MSAVCSLSTGDATKGLVGQEENGKGVLSVSKDGFGGVVEVWEHAVKQFHLFIACPIDAGVSPGFIRSIVDLVRTFTEAGINHTYYQMEGDSLVTRARNNSVAMFMANPKFTHFMFIDSDITFSCKDVLRMLKSGLDIVAGAYPMKQVNWDRVCELSRQRQNWTPEELRMASTSYVVNMRNELLSGVNIQVQDGVMTTGEVGTGFLMIRRLVFETLEHSYPEEYTNNDHSKLRKLGELHLERRKRRLFWSWFDARTSPVTRRALSEDWAFCQLCTAAGFEVKLMLLCNLEHFGPISFPGNFGETMLLLGKFKQTDKTNETAVETASANPEPARAAGK